MRSFDPHLAAVVAFFDPETHKVSAQIAMHRDGSLVHLGDSSAAIDALVLLLRAARRARRTGPAKLTPE